MYPYRLSRIGRGGGLYAFGPGLCNGCDMGKVLWFVCGRVWAYHCDRRSKWAKIYAIAGGCDEVDEICYEIT